MKSYFPQWRLLGCLYVCLIGLGLQSSAAHARQDHSAAQIPSDLQEGAHAVIRNHETTFTVLSADKGREEVRLRITVLNKKGDDQARLVLPYDKLTEVKSIKGYAYNAQGKKIDKLKRSEIEDRSNFGGSVFADNRVKIAEFSIHTYPYTVEWEYEVETTNMMFYPVWAPQDDEYLAVEKASLEIIVPAGFSFRYLEQQVNPVQINKQMDSDSYSWKVSGLKIVKREQNAPPLSEQVPIVFTAPSDFSVEGYAGNMDSWKNYGEWIQQLNSTQHQLPPEALSAVRGLTDGLDADREKVRAIYDYLQQNTRYVSIQLGIGGWQPFKASFVHEKGYGDCKALSNYTKTLLEVAGIPSYYTLIRTGNNPDFLNEDFPMSYFDHAILCVPQENDTIWLECTSQTNPFGYLGRGTSGRKVVLVTENGGEIARTRDYGASDNLQRTEAEVQLNVEQALVRLERTYSGQQFENGDLNYYLHQDQEKQKKWIYQNLGIPSFQLNDFQLGLEKNQAVPEALLRAELELKSLVTASNKRLFISPNLMNRHGSAPQKSKVRNTEFILSLSYTDEDKIVYLLPEGYTPEFIPDPVNIESSFGSYEASIEFKEGKLIYFRRVRMNKGRYEAAEFEPYIDFRQEIHKADQAKVVLVRQ